MYKKFYSPEETIQLINESLNEKISLTDLKLLIIRDEIFPIYASQVNASEKPVLIQSGKDNVWQIFHGTADAMNALRGIYQNQNGLKEEYIPPYANGLLISVDDIERVFKIPVQPTQSKANRDGKAKLLVSACMDAYTRGNNSTPATAEQLIAYCLKNNVGGYEELQVLEHKNGQAALRKISWIGGSVYRKYFISAFKSL